MSRKYYNAAYDNDLPPLPSWEKDHVAVVRYMESSSPELSSTEREDRESNTIGNDAIKVQYARKYAKFLQPPEDAITPIQVDTPLTAPPLLSASKAPVYVPPAPKTTQSPPNFVKARSPPHPLPPPPDKSSLPSTAATSASGSPQSDKAVTALPGTMSSRNARERSRAGERSGTRARTGSKRAAQRKPTLVRRWKSIFKDIFTYHPVDESQFERIEDRHWTDDY